MCIKRATCPAQLLRLDFIIIIMPGEQYMSRSFSLRNFKSSILPYIWRQNILPVLKCSVFIPLMKKITSRLQNCKEIDSLYIYLLLQIGTFLSRVLSKLVTFTRYGFIDLSRPSSGVNFFTWPLQVLIYGPAAVHLKYSDYLKLCCKYRPIYHLL
jgi:hypothetical protein